MKRTLTMACTAAAVISLFAAAGCTSTSTPETARTTGTLSQGQGQEQRQGQGQGIDLPVALCMAAHGHDDYGDAGYAAGLSREAYARYANALADCRLRARAPAPPLP